MKCRSIRKRSLSALLAVVMAFSLGACGKSPDKEKPEEDGEGKDKEVTLEWQQWWAVECPEGYVQDICDKYYEETGVRVELLSAPFADTKTQIVSGASTGTVADIVSVDSSWVYDFADQNLLTDMTALMEGSGFDQEIAGSQWQVDGKAYALPIVNFAYPMFANMDILNDCGITELPKTWTEFEAACKAIKDKGYYPYALNLDTTSPSGIQNVYMGFAWASGIQMKNEDGTYNLADNQDLKEYAEFMKGLNDKGYIYPGMSSLTEADMTSKFSSGELAFIINSAAVLQSFREEAPDLNIAAAPVPVRDGYTGKSGMCVASWALGITENSAQKEEAMKFIAYLMSGADGKDGSIDADIAVTQSAFPGSTLAEPDYSDADPVFNDIYEMYQAGFPINEFTGMKEANTIMTDFINELIPYMDGDQDADTYLGYVQNAIDEVYEE